jgi:hypothetical protein
MKFGILKSKIENVLLESYKNNTFKDELKTFKKLVIENKNVAKIFYLYDELNTQKGLNESYVNEFINESVKLYEKSISKITKSELKELNEWVKNSTVENSYSKIDDLFTSDVLTIESRIKSKKLISETLRKLPITTTTTKSIELPLSTMVSVANKTIKNYIDGLNESDKKELINLLSEDDSTLTEKYNSLKENVVEKLNNMKESSDDNSVKSRIDETLSKVLSEKFDKLSYFKLKGLNENL